VLISEALSSVTLVPSARRLALDGLPCFSPGQRDDRKSHPGAQRSGDVDDVPPHLRIALAFGFAVSLCHVVVAGLPCFARASFCFAPLEDDLPPFECQGVSHNRASVRKAGIDLRMSECVTFAAEPLPMPRSC
jgi:hypothetical protein